MLVASCGLVPLFGLASASEAKVCTSFSLSNRASEFHGLVSKLVVMANINLDALSIDNMSYRDQFRLEYRIIIMKLMVTMLNVFFLL